jgi:hypothetical protein
MHSKRPPSFVILHILPFLWKFVPFLMINCAGRKKRRCALKYVDSCESGSEESSAACRVEFPVEEEEKADETEEEMQRRGLYAMKKRKYDNVSAEEERARERRKIIGDFKIRSVSGVCMH